MGNVYAALVQHICSIESAKSACTRNPIFTLLAAYGRRYQLCVPSLKKCCAFVFFFFPCRFGLFQSFPSTKPGDCYCLLIYSKNTFRQGVSNDGGSHVETSSICAVPLHIIVVSSITFVRHLYVGESGAALVLRS